MDGRQQLANREGASPKTPSTSLCSSPEATLERLKQPVTIDRAEAITELSRALALCAPVGMAEQERALWLSAAYAEIADMQAEVFRQSIAKVRKTADHPAKIIPAITAEAQSWRAVGIKPTVAKPVARIPSNPVASLISSAAQSLTRG